MFRVLARFLSSLARLAVRSGRSKDVEIIVLRHQLGVLRRQIDRPALDDDDRALLGTIAAALPHPRRVGWMVAPTPCSDGTDDASPATGHISHEDRDDHPQHPISPGSYFARRREPDLGLPTNTRRTRRLRLSDRPITDCGTVEQIYVEIAQASTDPADLITDNANALV